MEPFLKKSIYSPYDLAQMCQVTQEDVFQWLKEGKIASFEVLGGHRRFSRPMVENFLKKHLEDRSVSWDLIPGHFRVLVVEDEKDLLEIMRDLLKGELGVEVRTEENGYHATLLGEGWHPDLIMLDFVIPGMNGFEVCRKIRENPQTRDIPVLAITSLANKGKREDILAAGVSDCMGKPFLSDILIDKVRSLLGIGGVIAQDER
ncbi:MAG: response regulator [Candidatus Omnitrophica bacterium]|nr:response regulator [Candidatus Omnitrophota bacterium]